MSMATASVARLTLYLRGIDLIDVEFHAGSKGLYLDVNVFKPREDEQPPAGTLEGASQHDFERAEPLNEPDTRVRVGFR